MKNILGLIIDMDGVLWRAGQPIVDLGKLFASIDAAGLHYRLATNNSSRTPQQFQASLARLGADVPLEAILTSALATTAYLTCTFPSGSQFYVIGDEGLHTAIHQSGFSEGETSPAAVVVGIDYDMTYEKMKIAALLIRSGLPFIATNGDRTLPTPSGFTPGAGALLAFLQAATDVEPLVIGKPQSAMLEVAMQAMGTRPSQTMCIGDRLETDILGGQRAGCATALVLSGASNAAQAAAWQPQPDLICADIQHVVDTLTHA